MRWLPTYRHRIRSVTKSGHTVCVTRGGLVSIVKPVISGTVSKSSNEANRARAFSIFYMVVNIGSFIGKTIVADIRIQMGVQKVPFFSAGASLVALCGV